MAMIAYCSFYWIQENKQGTAVGKRGHCSHTRWRWAQENQPVKQKVVGGGATECTVTGRGEAAAARRRRWPRTDGMEMVETKPPSRRPRPSTAKQKKAQEHTGQGRRRCRRRCWMDRRRKRVDCVQIEKLGDESSSG
uniref:Uncharacterized protein n=1 Tax=Oryza sativa subsp. japonica TaxID=39947 RepID=Q6YXE0_ORYSJ|nr:hypothetical protein [Oryza sativa Japonica Group]